MMAARKSLAGGAAHREAFAAEMNGRSGLQVSAVDSAEEAVREADVLICCTSSLTPVFQAEWLKPGAHVTNIGSKYKKACELPREVVERSAVLVTDSFGQVDSQGGPHGRHFLAETPHRARLVELADEVAGKVAGRQNDEETTLFCSVGLAGTEMVLADRALSLSPARA